MVLLLFLFLKNDWVGRVEKQLAGTDSWGQAEEEKGKAGNAEGEKTFCQPSKGSQHTNISLFDVSWKKKIRLETLVSKRPRNSLASITTREGDGGSLGNTDFE